jgi:hypothetical protein
MYWIKGRFSAFLSLPAQVHDAKDPLIYVRTVVEETIPKVDAHDRALLCCFLNCLSCTYTNMVKSRGVIQCREYRTMSSWRKRLRALL